jgi:hypothetical protein
MTHIARTEEQIIMAAVITSGDKWDGINQVQTYYFDVEKCNSCSLKERCNRKGKKIYSVSIKS